MPSNVSFEFEKAKLEYDQANSPEKKLVALWANSPNDSIRPRMNAGAAKTFERKNGNKGYIISLETSVRKLAMDSSLVFLLIPNFIDYTFDDAN